MFFLIVLHCQLYSDVNAIQDYFELQELIYVFIPVDETVFQKSFLTFIKVLRENFQIGKVTPDIFLFSAAHF